jgi:hypothetical protein
MTLTTITAFKSFSLFLVEGLLVTMTNNVWLLGQEALNGEAS